MKTRSDSLMRLLAAAAIICAAALMMTPVAARTPSFEAPVGTASGWQSDPEEAFADAEFGVDPMVTGPVSDAFRERQAALRCHERTWPDIPAACYPDLN